MVELLGSGARCQTAPCLSSGRRGPRGDPAMGDDGGSIIGAVNNDPTGTTWFKVKARPDFDWEIAPDGIVPGSGKYAGAAGAIRVQHPETGTRSELGSLAISDSERQWIWDHRGDLEGQAVAKFEAMEITEAGAVRAGIFTGLHQTKGSEDVLQLIGSHTTQVRDTKGDPYRSYIPGSDRSTVCVPCCS
jgi:hypothetical protein